ncbi:MAG: ABC transporter permease [Actinomycetota bacterium]|nr:ABC transporter permease [Actinomycetota bacterium]
MRAFLSQLRVELALSSRQGEQLLVSLGIPLLILVFFSSVDVLPVPTEDPVDFLAPGVLALAIMSTSLVSLGISTGFDRNYGVLKRLGASPLGRPRWIAAKIATVLLTEVAQWVLLIAVAVALGWSPPGAGWLPAVGAAVLGTAAFGGIALLMAGTLPGLATLAGANALYLVLLLTGGMVIPLEELPGPLEAVVKVLPAAPLAEILTGSLIEGGTVAGWAWISLGAWALAAPLAAATLFRWE